MTRLQYFRALMVIFAQHFNTFRRRPKRVAAQRHAPLRQTCVLPSPNACRLQSRHQGHALRTLGHAQLSSRPPRIQEQSACYLQDLGLPMAFPPRRGVPHVHFIYENTFVCCGGASGRCAVDVPRRSRMRMVHICVGKVALAPARCSFS